MKSPRSKKWHAMTSAAGMVAALLVVSCSQSNQQSPQHTMASSPAPFATFNGVVPASTTNKQCSLDIINGQPAGNAAPVADGSTVIFGGWAGNGHGQGANGFALVLKGVQQSYSIPLAIGVARADVAKVLDSEGMAKSGFNMAAILSGVTAGTYSLYVVDPASPSADCNLHRMLTVQ